MCAAYSRAEARVKGDEAAMRARDIVSPFVNSRKDRRMKAAPIEARSARGLRIAVVRALYNPAITDGLLEDDEPLEAQAWTSERDRMREEEGDDQVERAFEQAVDAVTRPEPF